MIRKAMGLAAAMTLVGALATSDVGMSSVGAQSGSGGQSLCDTAGVEQFTDVADGDYGAAYMLCMRALGLSRGMGDGVYGPDDDLDRAQMASFLVRLWRDVLGNPCPTGVVSPFTDVSDDNYAADDIECVYGLELTKGTTATTYGPWDDLEAWQITLFLYRTLNKTNNTACAPGSGSELELATACLLQLHVAPTEAEATASTTVTRAQMGVYVIGLWHNLSGRGLPPTPPQQPTTTTTTTLTSTTTPVGDSCTAWLDVEVTGSYDSAIEQEIEGIRTDVCDLEPGVRALVADWAEVRAAGCEYYGDQLAVDLFHLSRQYSETAYPIRDRLYRLHDGIDFNDWNSMAVAFSGFLEPIQEDIRDDVEEWDGECYVQGGFCPAWQYYVRITGDYDDAISQEIAAIRTDVCDLEAGVRALVADWAEVRAAGCELSNTDATVDLLDSQQQYLDTISSIADRIDRLKGRVNLADWNDIDLALGRTSIKLENDFWHEFTDWNAKCYIEWRRNN